MKGPTFKRFLRGDGTFGLHVIGLETRWYQDLYHGLLSASWPKFFSLFGLSYLLVNVIFGALYFLGGSEGLEGARFGGELGRWAECFFFSVQTLATIGYGRVSPATVYTNLLVTVESLLGVIVLATTTGLIFSRFSKPKARVVFSKNALITKIDGVPHFVFRMANERFNQIVAAQVTVTVAMSEVTSEGLSYRNLYDLILERSQSPAFALSWTVTHPIVEGSPIYGKTAEDLEKCQAEFIINLVGTDETISATIHDRHSYIVDEVLWGARFEDMLSRDEDGTLMVDMTKMHAIAPSGAVLSS